MHRRWFHLAVVPGAGGLLFAGLLGVGSPSAHAQAKDQGCPAGDVCAYTGKGETGQVYKVKIGQHLEAGKCYDIETGQVIDSLDNETDDTVVLKEGSCAHKGAAHPEDSTPAHAKTDEKTPIDPCL